MAYLIGIDVGTTGAKTILIDEKGSLLATALEEYPLHTSRPKWAEQDPEDWWQATVASIRAVLGEARVDPAEVKGLGLSGQMHGLVMLDKNYQVLRPAILWCDVRTTEQCQYITEMVGKEMLGQIVGNQALEGFTAPKIIWVRDNEPEIYEKADKILLPKDYVRFRLTGQITTEISDAAGTILLDIRDREWSKPVLERLEIDQGLLPPVYESIDVCGEITPDVAKLTGLKAGTLVAGGGADNTCSAVGNGIVKAGRVSASLGTSGVVFAHTDEVKVDPKLRTHTFCHSVPNKWYVMGCMLSAGGAFRWYRDALGELEIQQAREKNVDPYEILTAKAEEAPVGSEGLIFLPYLTGERTPHGDANAKATFFGLTLRHDKSHIIRSVLEGVTYGMRDSLEIIKGLDLPIDQVYATGGGARSQFWRQIQADIYDTELVTINIAEGPAFGAAILAGVASGVYSSIEEATDELIEITSRTQPIAENVEIYNEYYQIYRNLYPALKPQFDAVTAVVSKIS